MSDSTYTAFANPNFDPHEYANAILAGPASHTQPSSKAKEPEPAKEDISVAISKLSFGIEDVSKQIKNVVTTHHEALLVQAARVSGLESSLGSVRNGLGEITDTLDKLRAKIRVPYHALAAHVARLERLQRASDALRRAARFVVVARRLERQMAEVQRADAPPHPPGTGAKAGVKERARTGAEELQGEGEKERAIAEAALSIAELVTLLDPPPDAAISLDADPSEHPIPLRDIRAVAAHVGAVEGARATVTGEMQTMVLTGLSALNQSLLAASLQTAYNLGVLPPLVQSLVADLTDAVDARIRTAFDVARVSRDATQRDSTPQAPALLYRSRVRTEPTTITAPQWSAALWGRLESLVEEMAGCCIKVYTLEKVLILKKDTVSQTNFLDDAMKLLENKPSATFWTVLARTLERQSREAAKGSTFLQQTLSTGYPRLLRLFHDFFVKVAVHTDTIYTQDKQSPETILVLRALAHFEGLYLARCANRLNEAAAQALAGGPRATSDGAALARAAAHELDAARFDPLLVLGVARNVQAALELLLTRADPLILRDRWATSVLGPASTTQQTQNAHVASCLYGCWQRLDALMPEHAPGVRAVLAPAIQNVRAAYDGIVEPLLAAVRRELAAIIARLHRLDLGDSRDAASAPALGGPSTYMRDLADKLAFIKAELLAPFSVGDAGRVWVADIARGVLRAFVLHASIARPLGESGKLQLTRDMAELEFALGAFVADGVRGGQGTKLDELGDEYKALRAMRPLLFLETRMLSDPARTAGLPPLVVLHHILVRSPLPLPHTLHGWAPSEYVRWVGEHSAAEALALVAGGLARWEAVRDAPREELAVAGDYLELARAVLAQAKEDGLEF